MAIGITKEMTMAKIGSQKTAKSEYLEGCPVLLTAKAITLSTVQEAAIATEKN
jgi:hypothetical protein